MHISTTSAVEKLLRRSEYPVAAFSMWMVPSRNRLRE